MSRSSALVIVLPDRFAESSEWIDLFKLHFQSYGPVVHWTPLPKFARVILVYQEIEDALRAKQEMDGFVWDPKIDPKPIRLYSAPALLQYSQERLAPPTLEKNFLISPPGSPPVGWEQIQEDEPNKATLPVGAEDEWVQELERALRFLSVGEAGEPLENDDDGAVEGQPKVILAQDDDSSKPAITVSTPPEPQTPNHSSPATSSPPPGATKITQVKATVASLLGPSALANAAPKITPTARPPVDEDFSAFDCM